MTKQCHHHFLVNQEKGEKHAFRKSKKYRTLCSVALGAMVTAIVAWSGAVAQADEVTAPQDNIIQRTENPATNLAQAQPTPVVQQTNSLASTGQTDGAITVTVPHDTVTQAVNQAKAEGVKTVQDQPKDLGNTTSAGETNQQLAKAEADATKQAEEISTVTETYKSAKATYEQDKTRVESQNATLETSHKEATQAGNALNSSVDSTISELKCQDKSANVTVTTQTVSSGDGSTVSGYQDYISSVATINQKNKDNLAEYVTKKKPQTPLLRRTWLLKRKMKQV